ncbi:hypothetical protein [Thermoactinospora rubra]|uniref:hypothetical protein n=1 Tax=Thermoactinospora rubra TaxID=1088767 RepID=UPI001F0AFB52|nr:hypothetical protein [Thermoactinospora rubra]
MSVMLGYMLVHLAESGDHREGPVERPRVRPGVHEHDKPAGFQDACQLLTSCRKRLSRPQ